MSTCGDRSRACGRSSWSADMHVVVALADPMIRGVVAETNSPAVVADCDYANGQLPVAQGRNIGATAALRGGAELLVFLDVDCIPGATLIGRYHRAATRHEHAQALLCGPVTYLPPPGPQGYALNQLSSQQSGARWAHRGWRRFGGAHLLWSA